MPDQGLVALGAAARAALLLLALTLCLPVHLQASEGDFRIRQGSVTLNEGVYYLNARIDYRLSSAARNAMRNGVPLVVELEIELERPRRWRPDASVASLRQRYRLRYHDLSGRYLLTNLNTGESKSFPSETSVLTVLGRVEGLPVIDRSLLDRGEVYELRLRARLDHGQLPLPLRTVALFRRQWRLGSDWFVWRLQV